MALLATIICHLRNVSLEVPIVHAQLQQTPPRLVIDHFQAAGIFPGEGSLNFFPFHFPWQNLLLRNVLASLPARHLGGSIQDSD